jgi:hypothetical protein
MKSGQYIQVRPGDSLKRLAEEFKVPERKIANANPGRNIVAGEWVFIPLERGILGRSGSWEGTEAMLDSGEFQWPVPSSYRISSEFGSRWGKPHEGIDIPAREGTHFVAANDGLVVYSGDDLGGYGNITVIAHDNGYFTVYAHAYKNLTQKGQRVHRGQVIGKVGSTGRSTGSHLHFEVRYNSRAIDPKPYLARNGN